MVRDVIYIYDWWFSFEFYMRCFVVISQKWCLDCFLQKKVWEGVKIFVIIYCNVEVVIFIDFEYIKFLFFNLYFNIFVQCLLNQFKKNQYFYVYYEKICVVDYDVVFVGGIDLCFGCWDCFQYLVIDDKLIGFEMIEVFKDVEYCQLFLGKDYFNFRVQDFF